jgi:hypothetical protein
VSSWREIFNDVSTEEVEALACLEEIRLAANWERTCSAGIRLRNCDQGP